MIIHFKETVLTIYKIYRVDMLIIITHEVNKLDLQNICDVFLWRIFQSNIYHEYSLEIKCTYYLQIL